MPASFLDHLLTLPEVQEAALSPDGRWVAFAWYRLHPHLDIFLVPTDGSAPPVPLTKSSQATRLVSWTADSASLLVSEDQDGNERARFFRVDIERPGEMMPLTEADPPFFARGGNLHPNGKWLFYGANYDVGTGRTIEPTWLYRHDLTSGERLPIARPQRPAYCLPALNRPGSHLIYQRQDRHPAGNQIYLVDVEGREDREILNFGDRVKVMATWLPDGEHLLVLSDSRDGRRQAHKSLGLYHWPTGDLHWLVDDPARSLERAWVTPDGSIIVDEVREGSHLPTWLDPTTGQEVPFPRLPGNLLPLGRAPDGSWIGKYYAATQPTDLVRFTMGAGGVEDLVSLTRLWERTPLAREQLAPAEPFHWQSVDGQQIQGWLYRATPNPRRAILYVHGGPTAHSEDKLNAQIQYFVARGFNVLDVNYRGSTGFGLAFRELIKEDGWGGREQDDIAQGARALIDAGLAEPGRIGVTGTSYGGYSAWCQITRTPPSLIAAAAPICGMTDLVVDYETTRPDLRAYSEEMIGGRPDELPERYFERSPINFVQNIRGSLLVIQGARDPNVTPDNLWEVARRLEEHQVPYETLIFEDEGHGINKITNQKRLFERLAAFFDGAL